MSDDAEKLLDILEDKPMQHACESCGDAGMAPTTKLPPGWMLISVNKGLFDSLDEVDERSLIVCAICFGLLTRVIPKLATLAPKVTG